MTARSQPSPRRSGLDSHKFRPGNYSPPNDSFLPPGAPPSSPHGLTIAKGCPLNRPARLPTSGSPPKIAKIGCVLPESLPLEELPTVLLLALRRRRRRVPRTAKSGTQIASPTRASSSHFPSNNFIAKAPAMRRDGQTSPLGGRNRKGAGAPEGNRNAAGSRPHRLHAQLRKRIVATRLRLLVWKAAVDHWEKPHSPGKPTRIPRPNRKKSQNNFIAEAHSHAPPQPQPLASSGRKRL